MERIVALALAKAADRLVGKGFAPPVGNHPIDEVVALRIKGNVEKLSDEDYVPTVHVPLKLALALVLEKAGFQREYAMNLLVDAMTEALDAEVKGEETNLIVAQRIKDVEMAAERVESTMAALPKATRTGKTFVRVAIEELEVAAV